MLISLIGFLTANKELLGIGAILAAAVAVYLKGYSAGSSSVEADETEAAENLAKEIQSVEGKNQAIDQQRESDANKVNNAKSIDDLIGLWNDLNGKKTPSSDAKKNPK